MANEGLIYGIKLAAADHGVEMTDEQATAFAKQAFARVPSSVAAAMGGLARGQQAMTGGLARGQQAMTGGLGKARELPNHLRQVIRDNPLMSVGATGSGVATAYGLNHLRNSDRG